MKKFFDRPEMMISMFDAENVATTGSGPLTQANNDIKNEIISLTGGKNAAKAAAIFEFKITQ